MSTTTTNKVKYHMAKSGKSAGKWVPCEAEVQCRLGGKHIGKLAYSNLNSDVKEFNNVEDVFQTVELETETKEKKVRLSKEEYAKAKEAKLEKIHEELQNQIANLANDADWKNYLDTMSKFHTYSYNNQILIHMQKPDATRVAGYKKWVELGRNVKKGEKALAILAPNFFNKERKDANGNLMYGPDGKVIKDKVLVGWSTGNVFDISQTEGKDLPEMRKLTEIPPVGFKQDLEEAIKAQGYTISYEPMIGDQQGATNPTSKTVRIDSTLNEGQTAQTLAHELGHIAAGHVEKEKMAEYHTSNGGHRGAMEVEAESIAYVLCRSNGMSTQAGTESAPYVSGWAKVEKGEKTVENSAKNVAKVVSKLLSGHKWVNAVD